VKFIFADSLDFIDPRYNFANDSNGPGRQLYWDDQYPHEFMNIPPYDGILVSRGIVGDHRFSGRYTSGQSMRFRRVGARKFLRFEGHGLSDKPIYGDCGAFSYVDEPVPPYSSQEILDFYIDGGFTHGCSVDHVIFEFDREAKGLEGGSEDARQRFEITLANASDFKALSRRYPAFTPLGVVQGWSPQSKAIAAQKLERMGYDYLAIGGMVPLNAKSIHMCLAEIRKTIKPSTRLHLLGFAKAEQIAEFTRYGIESFDSTSPLLRAFKDARANYYVLTPDGTLDYYSAIRIPQATENPRLLRAAKEGRYRQEDLVQLETEALAAVRELDRGEGSVERALESILSYNKLFIVDPERTEEQNARAFETARTLLLRTLTDRPWKNCPCRVCESASVEVMIFRSSNRNKRRGFHNLGVYYDYVRRQLDVEHKAADVDVPSCRRAAKH
jgi:hypothetical protein